MRLTKEMKSDLADQLTGKAIANAIPGIAARMKAVNERFWADHIKAVEAVLPLPRKAWSELIILGVIQALTTQPLRRTVERENGSSYQESACSIPCPQGKRYELRNQIMRYSVMAPIRNFMSSGYHSFDFTAKASCSIPLLRGLGDLQTGGFLEGKLQKIEADLLILVEAAEGFHHKVSALLAACATRAHLEKVLPEAVDLLPPPVKKSNVVPAELMLSVQSMLNKGVPPSA